MTADALTRIAEALKGIRGRRAVPLERLEMLLVRFSQLVIDFREVDFGPSPPAAIDAAAGVRSVSWGRFRAGWSRLVAELSGPFRLTSAEERRAPDGGATLALRLEPASAAEFDRLVRLDAAQAATSGSIWALPPPARVDRPKRRQTGTGPLVVVLDPGHVDRGYADLPGKLRSLGADVERLD